MCPAFAGCGLPLSNESGRDEIYAQAFPDVTAGRWQVSTNGGRTPLWSRTG